MKSLGLVLLGAAVGALVLEALRTREQVSHLADLSVEDVKELGVLRVMVRGLEGRTEALESAEGSASQFAGQIEDHRQKLEVLTSRLNSLGAPGVRRI